MQGYKPYVDYILASGAAETAYILSMDGAILGTSQPIQQLPQYNFDLEDDNGKIQKIIVDERVNLLEAIANKGPCPKHPEGIRLYNQKYYPVNFEADKDSFTKFYLKKSQGGACICITKQLILIGTWSSTVKMGNGVPQNPGELNKRVQQLAKTLYQQGY